MSSAIYNFISSYNYYVIIFLMISGLFIVVSRGNMVKKLVGWRFFKRLSIYYIYHPEKF